MSQSVKSSAGGGAGDGGGAGATASMKRPSVGDSGTGAKLQRVDEGGAPPPTPPPKISVNLGAKKLTPAAAPAPKPPVKAISMKLGSKPQSSGPAPVAALKPKSRLAARAFREEDSDDENEEMPPEAKMRMKNIGRETPTSAGPNSFGKTKIGFCDRKKKRDSEEAPTEE